MSDLGRKRMGDSETGGIWLAGVDGCRAGWLAVFVRPQGDAARMALFARFADIATAPEAPAVIAVDIPVGLPARSGRGGRAAENAVRPLLGARQSSVFSVPARAAVYAQSYAQARRTALATSDPPRSVAKQLYNIAPKIREVDECLRADPVLARRVHEVHPELAFWRLNGERALAEPKKVRNRPHPPGLEMRRKLLAGAGLAPALTQAAPPEGAAADDVLDALACAAIARRIHAGTARPFPDPAPCDDFGLPAAIWA